jgi:translocator protein
MKKIIVFTVFLALNFGALALGGLFTASGVKSDWYRELNQAPWTPPGWVFGAAWTFLMICFSVFMTFLWEHSTEKKNIIRLYLAQWVLNVCWNPMFFFHHWVGAALLEIILLLFTVMLLGYNFRKQLGLKSLWILPYFVWLLIASSLNAYILFFN